MNNGLMGGYGEWMPDAVERYDAHRLGGDYAAVAQGARRPCRAGPRARRAARRRSSAAIASVADGRATLLEVMTHEEPSQPVVG